MRPLLFLFFLCAITPFPAWAQFSGNSLLGEPLSLELQPAYPSPGDTVTVTLNDYQGSAYGADIQWFLDGVLISGSQSQRQISITAGGAGSNSVIKAQLSLPAGQVETIAAVIKPLYLDIIVEPQTHVPDFYAGRALPSIGSTVNLTALISNGKMLNEDLMYLWRVDQQVLEGGPLRGRNKISFVTPQGKDIVVSLQVSKPDGTVLAKRSLSIPSVEPELTFYEVSTLYGVNRKAISGSYNLIGNSAIIKAEPYYLDSRIFNNPSIAVWSINGAESSAMGGNPYEVTLQRTGSEGSTELDFHVRSTDLVLQGARNDIRINF